MEENYKRMIGVLEKRQKSARRRKRMAEPWFVYMLLCADGTFYTGITNDVERRFNVHQQGKGARYTRPRLPLKLIYQEKCRGRSAALVREFKMKSFSRKKKEDLAVRFSGRCDA